MDRDAGHPRSTGAFRGIVNLRDVGGLPTVDGGRIASGRLLRSGRLDLATDADLDDLVSQGVRRVVDLRTAVERERTGPAPLGGRPIVEVHLPLIEALGPEPPREDHRPVDGSRWSPARLSAGYLRLAADAAPRLAELAELVAEGDGATLIHCWSGKDRTGVAVAVLLAAAGVTDEAIAADYAATADWFGPRLVRHPELQVAPSPVAYHPRPETMHAVLDGIRARWGSAEGLLRAGGAAQGIVARLRRRLLAP